MVSAAASATRMVGHVQQTLVLVLLVLLLVVLLLFALVLFGVALALAALAMDMSRPISQEFRVSLDAS